MRLSEGGLYRGSTGVRGLVGVTGIRGYTGPMNVSVSNPNILINSNGWGMIDQRNKNGVVLAADTYGFDRWVSYNSAGVMSQTGSGARLTWAGGASSIAGFCQRVWSPVVNGYNVYAGRTFTLSAKVRATSGCVNPRLVLAAGAGSVQSSVVVANESFQVVSCTYTAAAYINQANVTNMYLMVDSAAAGSWVEFEWMKLEEGGMATPYLVPDPCVEMARCRRYWQKSYDYLNGVGTVTSTGSVISNLNFATGVAYAHMTIKFPVAMRMVPALSVYDFSGNSDKVGWLTGNSALDGQAVGAKVVTADGFLVSTYMNPGYFGFGFQYVVDAEI